MMTRWLSKSAPFFLIPLIFMASPMLSQVNRTPETRQPPAARPRYIEVKVGDQQTFRLRVGKKKSERLQGIIPILGASEESYLRIKPRRSDDLIIVETFLVVGHLESPELCRQIDELPNYSLGIAVLRQGESRTLSLQGKSATISLGDSSQLQTQGDDLVLTDPQDPSGRPLEPPCCTCGALKCCPNPGKCLGCGNCGLCCR
jgi:hypothetical protein